MPDLNKLKMKLYHYCKFDTFLNHILPYYLLRFNGLRNTNDPLEFMKNIKIGEHGKITNEYYIANQLFKEEIEKYQVLCFTKATKNQGFEKPTMWAHYGENHNGICIEIDEKLIKKDDSIICNDIAYKKKVFEPNILKLIENKDVNDARAEISSYVYENINSIFFQKTKSWSVERERRFLVKNSSNVHRYLDVENCITGIYLGQKIEYYDPRIKMIFHFLGKEKSIPIRKVVFQKESYYEEVDIDYCDSAFKNRQLYLKKMWKA